jgi:hypothetical protein
MNKYTVFFDQINRTNFQVLAHDKHSAEIKAIKLFRKHNAEIPSSYVQNGWLENKDGEDK